MVKVVEYLLHQDFVKKDVGLFQEVAGHSRVPLEIAPMSAKMFDDEPGGARLRIDPTRIYARATWRIGWHPRSDQQFPVSNSALRLNRVNRLGPLALSELNFRASSCTRQWPRRDAGRRGLLSFSLASDLASCFATQASVSRTSAASLTWHASLAWPILPCVCEPDFEAAAAFPNQSDAFVNTVTSLPDKNIS